MKNFFKKSWPYFVFIIIAIVFALFWTRSGNIYGTDDVFTLFRDHKYLEKGLYFWENQESFGSMKINFTRLFFYSVEYFLNNNFLTHFIFYTLNISLALIFCFKFSRYLFKKYNIILEDYVFFFIALLYVFNPFNYYYTFQDQTGFQWLLSFMPFFLYFYLKALLEKRPLKYIILIFLGTILSGVGISHIFLFVLALFTLGISIMFYKNFFSKRILIFIIMLLLWAWFLIPFFASIYQSIYLANKGGGAANLIYFSSEYNTLTNVLRYVGYRPINFMPQHNGVMLNTEGFYYKTLFFMIIMFLSLVLIFISFLKKENIFISFIILFLVIIFLMSNISTSLVSQIPMLKSALRNSFNKFAIYYGLIFSVLLVYSIYSIFKKNYARIILIIVLLILISFPFLYSSPIYRGGIIKSYYVSVPQDYYEFYHNSTINKYNDQEILLLPLNRYGTTFFSWASPVESLILDQFTENKVSTVSYINEASKNITDSFWKDIKDRKYDDFEKDLEKYKISSIVFDNNIDWNYYTDLNKYDLNHIEKSKYDELINYLKGKYKFNTFGNIIEFVFEKKYPTIDSADLTYQKINPTKYRIYVKNLNKKNLNFLESYNKNWNLFINKHQEECNVEETFENNISKCSEENTFFEGEEIFYLIKNPLAEETHSMFNDYGNSWQLDSDYIKDHYSKDYYTKNPDGSINIELILYFKPQSYFYLGILISLITFVICIIYVIISSIIARNQKHKEVY